MKSLRPASHLLTAALLFAATGCRTAGVNNLAQKDPAPVRARESATELLAEHNRNAEKVQSLEASPSISGSNRSRIWPGASGRLAFERPRNFRLQISAGFSEAADIGSNDQEFWFWFKESPQKAVYYANYDESGASPLAAGLQPDWIVEAMGLRVIPESESSRMTVAPASADPTALVLTLRETTSRGVEYVKEIVLAEPTRRIREQRVYSAGKKTLLAQAIVSGHDEYTAGEPAGKVFLPRKLHLRLTQDKTALDVTMSEVVVNQFDPSRRQARFSEPQRKGFARLNMAEQAGLASGEPAAGEPASPPTSVRETMPAPPRIKLSEPAPLGLEGARRTRHDPPILAADLARSPARGVEAVVGAPVPTGPEPLPLAPRGRDGWRNSFTPAVER